jgi:hypothetical protein
MLLNTCMPFLFVDYDQGCGGERFCAELSQSPQCESLLYKKYDNGRTKVHDVFSQEFLKPVPNIDIKQSHAVLYTIVPTHRRTSIARSLLENVHSIRIQMPTDSALRNHIIEQQIQKVLLSKEPTPEYFFGLLKILSEPNNKDFIKKVKYHMLTVEIMLLSQGQDPTPQAVEQYLDEIRSERDPEPDQLYDLVIPYEHLVHRPEQVSKELNTKFGIVTVNNWLNSYA